ncbi:hypothetical protein [Tardiphaga robiniae]|uniref:hypothetical protein n=1 Tax=Tardiphaga robiniae TaxID=943830 RepID=UPI0015864CCB|nr:hypothetical protein [Tardiphaga robiniae]NUU41404.1 hypothetical protein [Tardiphaga robiniae]
MKPDRVPSFNLSADDRIDVSKVFALIGAVLLLGIMANIVNAASLALSVAP